MLLLAALLVWGQDRKEPAKKPPAVAEPAEEDTSLTTTKEYVFNPIQAENEIKVGRFYGKQGKWKAAAGRFGEAVKWNPRSAEGYLLLGEAEEKLRDSKSARAAYEKYLQLAPGTKEAADVRKRLARLGGKG